MATGSALDGREATLEVFRAPAHAGKSTSLTLGTKRKRSILRTTSMRSSMSLSSRPKGSSSGTSRPRPALSGISSDCSTLVSFRALLIARRVPFALRETKHEPQQDTNHYFNHSTIFIGKPSMASRKNNCI